MNEMEEKYAEYFTIGLKITACIPLDNNELFRDWAIVEALEGDILTLQLSRDELPARINLVAGLVLDLRLGKDGAGFRCNGIFVATVGLSRINVRLTGDVGISELRDFFRIDAFLPFTYQHLVEQNLDVLLESRRKRTKARIAEEEERREAFEEKVRDHIFRTAEGEFDDEKREQAAHHTPPEVEEFNPVNESWNYVNATAMNLSAGGFKIVTTDNFKLDELVIVEIYLPTTPPRIMDCIARVVFKNHNYSIRGDREYSNVAFNFVIIDERDRDAIASHISHLELLRIRNMHQMPIPVSHEGNERRMSPLRIAVLAAFLLIIAFGMYAVLTKYLHLQIFNTEIQDQFGDAVKKYRQETGTEKFWKF